MGVLDEPMAIVAETLVDTFVDSTRAFRREVTTYDPLDPASSTVVAVTAQVKTGPVAPLEERETSTASIQTGDQQVVVTRRHLAAKDFDPHPTTDTVVSVQVDGVWHKVIRVVDYVSGDLVAAYLLHLRK